MSDAELAQWVDSCLGAAGERRSGALELTRDRAWSRVYRVPTDDGAAWLKTPPPDTAFEVALYGLLSELTPDSVPVPLGLDVEHGWVLLPDAGPSLHERRAELDVVEAMATALGRYGELQLALADHVDRLLDCGVVDMRPEMMPQRFDEAVAAVGSSGVEHLRARYVDWCAQLAEMGRPASLDHNDLHAANVVGGIGAPRFYDWGDSVVAHPFASLLTTLDTVPGDAAPVIRDRYLSVFGDPVDLRAEAELACRVGLVARALVWLRALGGDSEGKYARAPIEYLQRLHTVGATD